MLNNNCQWRIVLVRWLERIIISVINVVIRESGNVSDMAINERVSVREVVRQEKQCQWSIHIGKCQCNLFGQIRQKGSMRWLSRRTDRRVSILAWWESINFSKVVRQENYCVSEVDKHKILSVSDRARQTHQCQFCGVTGEFRCPWDALTWKCRFQWEVVSDLAIQESVSDPVIQ